MRLSYKEYLQCELKRASKNEWFDIDGDNVIATSNRSFLSEFKSQVRGFNYDIKNSINLEDLAVQIIAIIVFISLPITYLPFLALRVHFTRKRAKKEMMESYNKDHPKNTI